MRRSIAVVLGVVVVVVICLARASDGDDAAVVRLAVADANGAMVKIPDGGQTTVLLFLLAGQRQSDEAIAALRGIVGQATDVRVVSVVGGAEAAAQVRQLVADKHPWPIVLDAGHALSGKLAVYAWPTTVIFSGQGEQVAHVAGQPKSYAYKVGAYLEFAAGRLDRPGLDRRLANPEAAPETPERHVQAASRLLEKGLVEQSRAELARAVALRPVDVGVQTELAELLLQAGDASAAAGVLERMDAKGLATARVKVLRGKLLIAAGKWDEARALLTSAVQLNPDPAEGLYQLGLVYQHDENWPQAADAFRRAYEHAPGARGGGRAAAK